MHMLTVLIQKPFLELVCIIEDLRRVFCARLQDNRPIRLLSTLKAA